MTLVAWSLDRIRGSWRPPAADITGKFDDGDLHAQADAQVWLAVLHGSIAPPAACLRSRVRRIRRAPGCRRSSAACRDIRLSEALRNRSIRWYTLPPAA